MEKEQVAGVEGKVVEPTQPNQDIISKQRFNQVYYKAKQAERDNDALRQENAALKQRTPTVGKVPELSDYDFNEEKLARAKVVYEDKLVQSRIDEAVELKFQDISKGEKAQSALQVENKFLERSAEYAVQNPEYDTVLGQAHGVQINQTASDIIMTSENGPAIHHHLLTNPVLLEKINSMQNPGLVGAELGRLESKLQIKPRSKAPEPITPEGGGAATNQTLYDPDLPMEDFYRLANQRE